MIFFKPYHFKYSKNSFIFLLTAHPYLYKWEELIAQSIYLNTAHHLFRTRRSSHHFLVFTDCSWHLKSQFADLSSRVCHLMLFRILVFLCAYFLNKQLYICRSPKSLSSVKKFCMQTYLLVQCIELFLF